jgi:predicted Zn-dependent protease
MASRLPITVAVMVVLQLKKAQPGLRLFLVAIIALATVGGPATNANAIRAQGGRAREATGQQHLERLRRIIIPLARAANHAERMQDIRVKVVADPSINAGSAGGGQFVVTTGLLQNANDQQLRGILAHEIAHDDLGHPAKMQLVGVGVGVGAALLETIIPGSGKIAPLAGTVIASNYSRPQELEADRHAVSILRRAGYSKEVMIQSLAWILERQGNSGGGFLSTHPATDERIKALKRL